MTLPPWFARGGITLLVFAFGIGAVAGYGVKTVQVRTDARIVEPSAPVTDLPPGPDPLAALPLWLTSPAMPNCTDANIASLLNTADVYWQAAGRREEFDRIEQRLESLAFETTGQTCLLLRLMRRRE